MSRFGIRSWRCGSSTSSARSKPSGLSPRERLWLLVVRFPFQTREPSLRFSTRERPWLFVAMSFMLVVSSSSCASRTPRSDGTSTAQIGDGFDRSSGDVDELAKARDPLSLPDSPAARPVASAEFPDKALDLLTQSTRDSCAICAERNRKKAFETLDTFYAAGTLITSGPERQFLREAEGSLELGVSSYRRAQPRLTFRFHTESEHLVGVDPADYTDDEWAAHSDSTAGRGLDGMIQVIEYPYGDGPTYLYSPSENHLQVQCKVLDLTTR